MQHIYPLDVCLGRWMIIVESAPASPQFGHKSENVSIFLAHNTDIAAEGFKLVMI
jgi:hypothetical protein